MHIVNDCDVLGFCQTGLVGFEQRLAKAMPQVKTEAVIIDALQQARRRLQCAVCGTEFLRARCGAASDLAYTWNDRMFQFLRDHPLSAP